MTDLVVIGAGKFALEVTRYIKALADYRIEQYLALESEQVHVPTDRFTDLAKYDLVEGTRVVLAVSDPAARPALIDLVAERGLVAENIIHPAAGIDSSSIEGTGNIVGPDNYVGVNAVIGSFNVLNYRCSVGHHSRIGTNNFFSPNFHCGNSISVGNNNFFGLSITIAPGITIGDDCRFQAGISLFDDAASGFSYLSPSRIKSIKSY